MNTYPFGPAAPKTPSTSPFLPPLLTPDISSLGSPFLPRISGGLPQPSSPFSAVSPFPSTAQPTEGTYYDYGTGSYHIYRPGVPIPAGAQLFPGSRQTNVFTDPNAITHEALPGVTHPGMTVRPGTAYGSGGGLILAPGEVVTSSAPVVVKPPKASKKKGKGKAPAAATPLAGSDPNDYLTNLINNPPGITTYNAPDLQFPDKHPLTDAKLEALIDKTIALNNHDWAIALQDFKTARKMIANSPDLSKEAKKEANDQINSQINSIRRMQDQEVQSGQRQATQILAASQAAGNLQLGIGNVVGNAYANAAGVMKGLGEAVGAGVQGMGAQDLAGIANGPLTQPLAGGLMPGGIPAAAGQTVNMLGGAIPAQGLGLQAAGVGPGYLGRGAADIAGQMAAQLQAGGANMATGAQMAAEQRARDLNSKILDAQGQFPQLYSSLFNTLQSHQDAHNAAILGLAQSGMEAVSKTNQARLDPLLQKATRFAAQAKYDTDYDLAKFTSDKQDIAAGRAQANFMTEQGFDRWKTQVTLGVSLQKVQAAATGAGKPLTKQQAIALQSAYATEFPGLNGNIQFGNNKVKGAYGDVETSGVNQGLRPLKNVPMQIADAFQYMVSKYGPTGLIGSPTGTAEQVDLWKHFMAMLKANYRVPNWSDDDVVRGVGRIPGTNIIAKLPINPLYTEDGEPIEFYDRKHPDRHDPPFLDDKGKLNKFWKERFEKESGGELIRGTRQASPFGSSSTSAAPMTSTTNFGGGKYETAARSFATQAGLPPDLFAAQIKQESGFSPGAASGAGAHGIAQIVPKYHPDAPPASDPMGQLKWAATYMAGLVRKYGSYEKALSVYNSGKPDSYLDPNFANGETYNYVKAIMGASTLPYTGGGVNAQTLPNTGGTYSIPGFLGNFTTSQSGWSPTSTPAATGSLPGLAEAFYDPLGSYDNGQFGGAIGGHSNHVHISASTPEEMLHAIQVAQGMGLSVRENPYLDPVERVHVDNSFHYRNFPGSYGGKKLGQAIDVSGSPDRMAAFYRMMTSGS